MKLLRWHPKSQIKMLCKSPKIIYCRPHQQIKAFIAAAPLPRSIGKCRRRLFREVIVATNDLCSGLIFILHLICIIKVRIVRKTAPVA